MRETWAAAGNSRRSRGCTVARAQPGDECSGARRRSGSRAGLDSGAGAGLVRAADGAAAGRVTTAVRLTPRGAAGADGCAAAAVTTVGSAAGAGCAGADASGDGGAAAAGAAGAACWTGAGAAAGDSTAGA